MAIASSGRIEVHEYRWTSGGKTEDHGHKLYTFRFSAVFTNDKRYKPPLFPDTLNGLRALFAERRIGELVIPDVGKVLCKISDWSERHEGDKRRSATADIEFLEEESNRFLAASSSQIQTSALQAKTDQWAAIVKNTKTQTAPTFQNVDFTTPDERAFDLFDQITGAANQLLAFRDQSLLYSELLASKIDSLTGMLREANSLTFFNNPMKSDVLFALKELWAATLEIARVKENDAGAPKKYTVVQTMTVSQVAAAIYGSTERAGDLLGLNDFPDAMRITAGTRVTYLP